eukprot:Colp12_sorted_trinity150504_noHs@16589
MNKMKAPVVILVAQAILVFSAFALPTSTLRPNLNGWIKGSPTADSTLCEIRIALKQHNLAVLEKIALEVSDPSSPFYGNHLSNEQVKNIIAPPNQAVEVVRGWLGSDIPHTVSVHGDYVIAHIPADRVKALFGISELSHFTHPFLAKSGRSFVRTDASYTLPSEVAAVVDFVTGISDFPPVSPMFHRDLSFGNLGKEPGMNVNPPIIRKLYGLSGVESITQKSGQAVALFEESYFFTSDITAFEQKYGLPEYNITQVVGFNDPFEGYLGEAALDTQYVMGIGVGNPTWVFERDPFDLVAWALNVTSTPGAPKVRDLVLSSKEKR